jgi:hypothetical protein
MVRLLVRIGGYPGRVLGYSPGFNLDDLGVPFADPFRIVDR